MTMDELQHVRILMAEARVSSLKQQIVAIDQLYYLACDIAEFWKSKAPEGIEYPPELQAKIDAAALTQSPEGRE